MAVIKHGSSGTGGTEALKFAMDGLTGESGSAVCVTGYSITTKQEVKEVRGLDGSVDLVGLHRKTDDITIDFAGAPSAAHNIGATLPADYHTSTATAADILVDEVTTSISPESVRTTSVKATAYH